MKVFAEDFTKQNFGWFGQQAMPNRLILQSAITRIPGKPSLQIIVSPGDCPLKGLTTERSEMLQMLSKADNDINADTPAEYYAMSLYLPGAWKDTQPAANVPLPWCIPFQIHGPDTVALSPVWQFDLSSTPGRYTLIVRGGDIAKPAPAAFIDLGAHAYNTWVDFVFKRENSTTTAWKRVLPSKDLQLIGALTAPNLYTQNGAVLPHYIKRGCYRNASNFTTIFYSGNFACATSFEEAAYYAFWGG